MKLPKPDIDLNELCQKHCVEGVTGRLFFSKGFYPQLCKQLGLEYKKMSFVGRQILKGDAIETLYMKNGDYFKTGEYYKRFYKNDNHLKYL